MNRTIAHLVVSCVMLAVGFQAEMSFGAETFFQAWVNGVNIYNCYVKSPTEARVRKVECKYQWSEPNGFHEESWGKAMAWKGWFSASIDLIHDRGGRLGPSNHRVDANSKAFFVDMTISGPPGVSSVRAPICFELQGSLSANPSRTYPTTGVQNHALANFRGWVGTDVETDFNGGINPSFVFQAWITETVGWSGLMGRPETERAVYQLNVATYPEISWAPDVEMWQFGAETSVLCTTEMDLPVGVPHQVGLWLMAMFDGQIVNTEWTLDNGRSSGGAYMGNSLSFPIGEPVYRLPEGYTLTSQSAGIVDNRWKFQDCNFNNVPDWEDIARGTIIDEDLDGILSGGGPLCPARDCDDNDPSVYPGALDVIDGKDNDCNGHLDDLYGVIDLGTLGGYESYGVGINNIGQVVGGADQRNYARHAFRWSEDDGMIDLGNPLSKKISVAMGINDLGWVVGESDERRAFLWRRGAGISDLGTLGGSGSIATDINNIGQVVGRAQTILGRHHGFLITPEDSDGDGAPDLWSQDADGDGVNDLMLDLGHLGYEYSEPIDINDVGQIVGHSYDNVHPGARAFLWTEADGMIDLGSFGGDLSSALAINNLGQVVGHSGVPGGEMHAFLIWPPDTDGDGAPDLWSQDADGDGVNDLMLDLGTLSASDYLSTARGINNHGQVVGYVSPTGYSTNERAFIIYPGDTNGNKIPDLWNQDADEDGKNDLMVELTTLVSDAENRAQSINDLGQVVGTSYGMTESGFELDRAVLWTGGLPLFTPTGTNVIVTPTDSGSGSNPVTLTFDEVTTTGLIRLTTTSDANPPPYGFSLGDPPTYYNMSTNATYSGSITACIDYSGVSYVGSEQDLKLYHFEYGEWVEVTPQWINIDNQTVCGDVTSLSLFAVFEPADSDGDGIPDSADGCPADPLKVEPGTCGCGVVDNEEDSDSDGTPDCIDGCPLDPLNDADDDGLCGDVDQCPNSDLSVVVVIQGCHSGVPNHYLLDGGCTILDGIWSCAAAATNHGEFVSCVSHLTNALKSAGVISGEEKGNIQICAAESDIP